MRSVRFTVVLVCIVLWRLAGAAIASANAPENIAGSPESFLLLEWPELKNAPAPFWLKEGVRRTYEFSSMPVAGANELWEDSSERHAAPRELSDSAGRDYTEVSVVGLDRSGVAVEIRDLGSATLNAPLRPVGLGAVVGAPGMLKEWWINPDALAAIPDGRKGAVEVRRMPYAARGITYNAVRFGFDAQGETHALVYDLKSGILVYKGVVGERRLPLRGASDDRTATAGQPERAPVKALVRSMLVEYREMSFPWTHDLPPSWTEEFQSATFAGSITAALPGTTSLPFQTSSVMTVTARGRRWFLYRTQDTTAALSEIPPGVAMRDGDRISGIAQVGGLWIPPMGFTRLRQGQTIDTAPVTGAKITVAAVDDAFVTFREQAAGYSADYWYNRTSGALSHIRFVDRTAGQIVDQKRTH